MQFACRDVVPGCRSTFVGSDVDAVLEQVATHARTDHGLVEVPDSLLRSAAAHIVPA